MEYAYVRVSTVNQNEDRQIAALEKLKLPKKNIYIDKESGKDFNRPQYKKLIRRLKPDDVIYIHSLDRLGRNYDEILKQWRMITVDRGVDIVVLDMPILDTHGDKSLINRFMSDVVLQILSFVSENERNSIRTRQAEGIAAAKAKGARFGRPRNPLPEGFPEAAFLWHDGTLTMVKAAKQCGMSYSTFYRRTKELFGSADSEMTNEEMTADK